jgi:hypothetical protein
VGAKRPTPLSSLSPSPTQDRIREGPCPSYQPTFAHPLCRSEQAKNHSVTFATTSRPSEPTPSPTDPQHPNLVVLELEQMAVVPSTERLAPRPNLHPHLQTAKMAPNNQTKFLPSLRGKVEPALSMPEGMGPNPSETPSLCHFDRSTAERRFLPVFPNVIIASPANVALSPLYKRRGGQGVR